MITFELFARPGIDPERVVPPPSGGRDFDKLRLRDARVPGDLVAQIKRLDQRRKQRESEQRKERNKDRHPAPRPDLRCQRVPNYG